MNIDTSPQNQSLFNDQKDTFKLTRNPENIFNQIDLTDVQVTYSLLNFLQNKASTVTKCLETERVQTKKLLLELTWLLNLKEKYKKKIEELIELLNTTRRQKSQKQFEIEQIKDYANSLQREIDKCKYEFSSFKDSMAKLSEDSISTLKELESAKSQIEELKVEKDDLLEALDRANSKIKDMYRDNGNYNYKAEPSNTNSPNIPKRDNHLDIQKKLAQLSSLKEENAVLNSDLLNSQSLRKYFMERASAYEKEVRGHRIVLSTKDDEIAILKKRISTLAYQKTFDHKTLEEKISKLESELDLYRTELLKYKSSSENKSRFKSPQPQSEREKKKMIQSEVYLPILPKPQLFHFREKSLLETNN